MSTIANSHILITGGASGIGLKMGKNALERGASKLVIWDINTEKLEECNKQLANFRDRIHTYKVDVSDPEQIYQSAKKLQAEINHLDILINNAGVVVGQPFQKQNMANINKTIAVNLLGVMHTTRAFLPQMIERSTGHIVNIASAVAHMGNPNMSVYAGSKWGVRGWSESLRIELNNQNVTVTSVEPGYIDTGMFKGVTPPLLTPLLDPENLSRRILRAVEKNKMHLRTPFMVKILPFLKGILPTKVFDFVAGKLFKAYHSMDTFTGRNSD
ncbi:all-trans-retinol dehydrogenase (NAD+) [Fodinibius salinus]|uniref:All-trans-retinol dehydrogenase (NAD+) n=1 Tax=Fodinibius salinus TaxID=860790 RepID=A0A5D3YJ80_9BACT|nr:SDR family oxidoreductase [Fodinibius salinus]TYP93894.1 all-trans-retinol dehydrogenase (NAD+) [Fodinibius salinus]